ncbi:hypothetical protein Pint_31171 [Pistacia integerrima]|uniref:Uncharacterized protein n=1 Tax=Pistacia integerrima TaxID=434235 RepID=A0ACC0XPN3_9ROSI|nr:hypothetical protein Pint_31171 [Pistacia integerrima]
MMGSNEFTGNSLLEPRDDMEFESHEAAYSFYKEYAKAMGFGTAKLSSRRSRASREFIDAKFSCIRFGNKQQSDDAINPRPSPKIGCKASMHVKRRPNGKWSWTEEQFEKRWWKLVDKFHLREVPWIQSLYEDRKHWVPTFMRGISFAALSTISRSESLNSTFDKYVRGETLLREFIEQYRVIIEVRYEEEAKADFDAWHETPELKSPSPFEKQMSLVYTHEIFKKFQVEVLGAAACHLKKENEVDTASTYSVKDFEDDQNYMVEWNQSKSDIYCSCRSFEYKGYVCRHAIIVLQMSGVFSIPSKYILQRWTNAAKSKHAMSERLDEVQSKVRRYNDLCRRAIILGEEGSLSQESYNIALGAIQEALKQCATLNNFMENNVRPIASDILALCDAEEENQFGNTSKDKVPNPSVTSTNSNPSRTEAGKGKGINANKKGKSTSCMWQITQPGTMNVETQDGCHQMELSDMRPTQLHNFVPTQLQVLPTMFHNVPTTQFHNVTTTHLPDNRLPR